VRPATPNTSQSEWSNSAACAGLAGMFYPDQGNEAAINRAKAVCRNCLVREACLADALTRNEQWGIWGGLTETERAALRRGTPRQACPECGQLFVPTRPNAQYCSTKCNSVAYARRMAGAA